MIGEKKRRSYWNHCLVLEIEMGMDEGGTRRMNCSKRGEAVTLLLFVHVYSAVAMVTSLEVGWRPGSGQRWCINGMELYRAAHIDELRG